MSLQIIAVIIAFFVRIFLLLLSFRRLNVPRQTGPDEGIEDDSVVRAYDRISRWPQFRLIRRMIIKELRKHQPDGSLVDIGCGPGYLLADMARSFQKLNLIGVDISAEMVERAANNLAIKGLDDRVTFRVGDIQGLPFEDSSVDFATSTLSLHHWSDPKQALHEISRILRPGGRFLIFDLRRDSPKLMYWLIKFAQWTILPKAMKRINEPTSSFLASYTPAELTVFMPASGFVEYRIKPGIFWVYVTGQKGII